MRLPSDTEIHVSLAYVEEKAKEVSQLTIVMGCMTAPSHTLLKGASRMIPDGGAPITKNESNAVCISLS